jgi:hypothetical protein
MEMSLKLLYNFSVWLEELQILIISAEFRAVFGPALQAASPLSQ